MTGHPPPVETEFEEETGRWIAEISSIPGCLVYGNTEAEAVTFATALAERCRMKKIPCSNGSCSARRPHHERPDETRPHQLCEVPDDYEDKAFCSYSCAMVAGYYSATKGWIRDPKKP